MSKASVKAVRALAANPEFARYVQSVSAGLGRTQIQRLVVDMARAQGVNVDAMQAFEIMQAVGV